MQFRLFGVPTLVGFFVTVERAKAGAPRATATREVDESEPTVNNCSLRTMYRRPKFLEILLEIRREMALEADYDVDLFAEIARSGNKSSKAKRHRLAPVIADPPNQDEVIPNLRRSREA